MESWMAGLGQRTVYVVVSRSMNNWADYYGAPKGYAQLLVSSQPRCTVRLSTTMTT